jgi:hypothetical protein
MRIRSLSLLLVLVLACAASAQDCVDYADDPAAIGSFSPPGGIRAIATDGDLLYALGQALYVLDMADPTAPQVLGSVDLGPSSQDCLAVVDGRAYCGSYANLTVIDVTDPNDPTVLAYGFADHNIAALDVAGDLVFAIGGFLTDYNYFQVLDISDLDDIRVVAEIETMNIGEVGGVQAAGDRVYITNPYQGLGVVEVAGPTTPQLQWTEVEGSLRAIEVQGALAYAGTGGLGWTGLHVIDIVDPDTPVVVGSLTLPSFVRDVTVVNDVAYCALNGGLAVVALDDPAAPELIGVIEYEYDLSVAATHQWVASVPELEGVVISLPQCVATAAPQLPASGLASLRVAPNPFNPRTVGRFVIDHAQDLQVSIVDLRGRWVRTLVARRFAAGAHAIVWDGLDGSGQAVPSGTYLFRIVGSRDTVARPISLVR